MIASTGPPLRILFVEDSEDDAEMAIRALERQNLRLTASRVDGELGLRSRLPEFVPDVVVVDWSMPGFSGSEAIAITQQWDASVPCILLSGALGDELVVEAVRTGAADSVSKLEIDALGRAIRRAVAEAAAKRDRDRLAAEVATTRGALVGALDAMPDPFVLCTAIRHADGSIDDFEIQFANRAAAPWFSLDATSEPGRGVPTVRGCGDLGLIEAMRSVVATGVPYVATEVPVRSPGSASARPTIVDLAITGFGDGFFLTFRDVTERVEFGRERERLAAVVEQTVDGVLVTDAAGSIVYANPAFLRLADSTLEELVGRPAGAVAHEFAGPEVVAGITTTVGEARPWLGEIVHPGEDGNVTHLQVSVSPTRNDSGANSGYVVVSRDVSALRDAEEVLAFEGRIRLALAACLRAIPDEASLEEAARAVCDELITIPRLDLALVEGFLGPEDLAVIAAAGPASSLFKPGHRLPPVAARRARLRSAGGAWSQYWRPSSDYGEWGRRSAKSGLQAIAFGPILRGDELVGGIMIGTRDTRFARTLVERMPAVMAIGATASAILATGLHGLQVATARRTAVEAVLETKAFHPVFQPIVDLESDGIVGYEALTRFDSELGPDTFFADAWSVGLGVEAELATLEAAVLEAKGLPSGPWLDLNVSPRLLTDTARLQDIIGGADRPIVLEVTEHDIISDYGTIRDAVRSLGPQVRLAVDDAGAGAANFAHIVELRPDFVKLDMGLVRGANLDLGRQAVIIAMRHFSRTAGCRLVAEGIETREEALTLLGLGVDFGQGYLLGRPGPAAAWSASRRTVLWDRPKRVGRARRPR